MKHKTIKITALVLAFSVLAMTGCAQGPVEKREEAESKLPETPESKK